MSGILSYGLAIAGLLLVIGAMVKMFVGNVRYPEARNRLIQMLRTDPQRAAWLCTVKTNTFSDAIGAAIKTGASIKSTDIAMIVLGTIPAYDAAATMIMLSLKQHIMAGKLGAGMAAGGLVLAVSKGSWPIPLVLFALLGGIGLLVLVMRKLEVERGITRARAEVLPEVDRMLADGRYVIAG